MSAGQGPRKDWGGVFPPLLGAAPDPASVVSWPLSCVSRVPLRPLSLSLGLGLTLILGPYVSYLCGDCVSKQGLFAGPGEGEGHS